MVDVPIEDQHTLESEHVKRVTCRDGDVVEQAETHRAGTQRVMPRRAVGAEADRACTAPDQPPHELDGAPGRVQRCPIGPGTENGVDVQLAAAGRRHGRDLLDLSGRMHALQNRPLDRRRADTLVPEPALALEQRVDRLDPQAALRMLAGVVLAGGGMG